MLLFQAKWELNFQTSHAGKSLKQRKVDLLILTWRVLAAAQGRSRVSPFRVHSPDHRASYLHAEPIPLQSKIPARKKCQHWHEGLIPCKFLWRWFICKYCPDGENALHPYMDTLGQIFSSVCQHLMSGKLIFFFLWISRIKFFSTVCMSSAPEEHSSSMDHR